MKFRNKAYLNITLGLKYCRVEIYHGSPRSLLYLDEPIEGIFLEDCNFILLKMCI